MFVNYRCVARIMIVPWDLIRNICADAQRTVREYDFDNIALRANGNRICQSVTYYNTVALLYTLACNIITRIASCTLGRMWNRVLIISEPSSPYLFFSEQFKRINICLIVYFTNHYGNPRFDTYIYIYYMQHGIKILYTYAVDHTGLINGRYNFLSSKL